MSHLRDALRTLAPVERRIEMDALASARDRHRVQPHVGEDAARQLCDLHAFREPHPLARVEVEDEAGGVLRTTIAAELPLRHVYLQRRDLPQPGECCKV